MKITLTTVGSTGDVLPFLLLAKQLTGRGHEILVCSNHEYQDLFKKENISFVPVGPPIEMAQAMNLQKKLFTLSPLKQLDVLVSELFLKDGARYYQDVLNACKHSDLAICHSLDFLGQQAVEAMGIPWISVFYCPGIIPTKEHGPLNLFNLGGTLNRLGWIAFNAVKKPFERRIERYLFQLDRNRRRISLTGTFSPFFNLVAAGCEWDGPYQDIPSHVKFTGPWLAHEGTGNPTSPDLQAFLAQGKVDVVVTFGSMACSDGNQTASILEEALRPLDVRVVVIKGWSDMPEPNLGPKSITCSYAPYRELFPHARVVVHHGGAGTTYAASAAGALSVVVPHLADQYYWGRLLQRLGTGSKPIPRKRLTGKTLRKRIQTMLESPQALARAHQVKHTLERDGLTQACRQIETLVIPRRKIPGRIRAAACSLG